MHIESFFDSDTATVTYVVSDPATQGCAIIDSVLDYDANAGRTSTTSADKVIAYVTEKALHVEWILETHIHADHLTASSYLKEKLGGKTGIGTAISKVLEYWVPLFNTAQDTPVDGSQFDHLFRDGDTFKIGSLEGKVIATPGHTPACVSYLIGDAVFCGDTLFMPRGGTARADFPGGDAATLYRSIRKILSLPDATRIFICHDYPPQGEQPAWETTVAAQKTNNIFVKDGISEAAYVETRTKRDKTLAVPRLLLPSIQINLRGGKLGKAENNGVHYVKIPLNKI